MNAKCQQHFEQLLQEQEPHQWVEDIKSIAASGMVAQEKGMTHQQQIDRNKRILSVMCAFCQAGVSPSEY